MAQAQQSRIALSIKNKNSKALIPFIVSGFPDIETTKELVKLLEKQGVAAIELGMPFSDPLADGPVIQKASRYALDHGINPDAVFSMLSELKDIVSVPLIIFSYINPIIRMGYENFIQKAADANVAGIIAPDLPLEEAQEFSKLCKANGIDLILLVAPTSSDERIKAIAEMSEGFIYLVSSVGVTGVRDTFSDVLPDILSRIKNYTDKPVAVGFGISKPEHIEKVVSFGADGAIVGSALIRVIDENMNNPEILLGKVSEYIQTLSRG